MIRTHSGLRAIAYRGATPLPDPKGEMGWIRNLNFRSGYPGGLYLDASFDAPRELHDWWAMNGMDRLAIFAGRRLAYEGYLIERERIYSAGADETLAAHLVGGFGAILMKERMAKAWQDIRIDDEFWREQKDITVYTGAEKATVDRNNRLRFTPKEVAWVSGEFGAVRYTMSIGETTKTVSYVCTVAPGGQSWEVAAYRSTNGTSWTLMNNANGDTFAFGLTTSVQTTGTQQVIITLGTPSRYVELRFYARANQTPATDGTIYGELTELTITSASGLAADTVAADIVAAYSDKLNADVEHIFPINLSLGPFVAEDDTLADILDEAIAKGDVNHNRLAFGLLASDRARTPDGKPVLFLETYPDPAAGYDLVISRQDQEDGIVGDVDVSKDWSRVANSIHLRFNDAQGYTVRLTPDDDATLKDQTSIDRWGRLPGLVSLGYSVQATALANAKRILKTYKDPLNVAQPISVTGAIRTASSGRIHAALCRAGLRLKLADVVDELTGAPATMVITGTSYDDESETAQLTFGQAQDPLLTILEAPLITEDEEEDGGSGGGGGKTGHTQIWKLLGMTREQYEAKGGKAWWATSEEKKAAIRRKKKTGRYKPQK